MALFPLLILFVLFFSGIPIAYAMLGAALLYFCFMHAGMPASVILENMIETMQSFSMLTILFFIMAGAVLNYAGIGVRLQKLADALVGHLPGSLAQVNVVWSMLMGGVSGSANADAAMQCMELVPEMERCGYSKGFSAAITAASSAVTPVIPPGLNLIVYALLAGVSLEEMFMAGFLPGILMAAVLMFAVQVISGKRNYPAGRKQKAERTEILSCIKESAWGLLFPLGIILGLGSGLFTMPETGVAAVLYSILIGTVCYKELKLRHLWVILRDTVETTASVALIMIAASLFELYMSCEHIPEMLTGVLFEMTQNKYVMLLLINVLLLILGMFFEGGAILIVMTPLLTPVAEALGVDLIHFGIMCIVNTMIGGLTPPFGSMMFTCCSITGCRLGTFVKECAPFIAVLLFVLLMVTYIPGLTMWIPGIF